MKLESWSFHGWQLYIEMNNKLALLWGEAQKKFAYSYLKVI